MSKKFEYVDDNPGSYFGMLVESLEDNKLEEADTLAKPFKKDIKNRYKAFDRNRDWVKQHNKNIEKKYIKPDQSDEEQEIIRDVFFKKEPKFNKLVDIEQRKNLETKSYPYYVTYYVESPHYHPEEGGYYVASNSAVASKGFNTREEAVKYAQEYADGMKKLSDTEYISSSKYIGDNEYVYVESEKDYLSREEGDKQYESLKESKSNSKETAKEIAKQFGVNPKIVSTKLGYYKIPVKMLLGDFIKKAKDNNFINAGNKNRFYKDMDDATVFVEFDEKNSAIYIDFEYEKEESLKESVSKSDLYSALEYMYGFNKKEANDWISKASDEMKQSVVDGWKRNAKKSALTDSLKEDKFVPQDKMSKKAQKELNNKKRGTWGNTNPVTRVQPNKKAYDRKRDKKELDEALDNRFSDIVKNLENIYVDMKYRANISDKDVLHYYNKLKNILETLHEYL
jgi:hypothetical protein